MTMDILLRGKRLDRLRRLIVRYTHFFRVGHDRIMPVAFAKQVKHQIPLGFSHARVDRFREIEFENRNVFRPNQAKLSRPWLRILKLERKHASPKLDLHRELANLSPPRRRMVMVRLAVSAKRRNFSHVTSVR